MLFGILGKKEIKWERSIKGKDIWMDITMGGIQIGEMLDILPIPINILQTRVIQE